MLRAMPELGVPKVVDSAPTVGLAWLVRLRWGAAVAQLAMIALTVIAFATPVAVGGSVGLFVVTLITNGLLLFWLRSGRSSSPKIIGGVLLIDSILLTAMLAASGGPTNPFTAFYIVNVALAALLLDTRGALLLALVTSLGFGSLFWITPDEAMHVMHHGKGFSLHLQGMWVAYMMAAGFVGYFVAKVARALERREREVAELSRYAARTEKLAALSTLAAGAAHELGTPLGTIAIIAKELERAAEKELDRAGLIEDAKLLRAEAERCREILARMGPRVGELAGEAPRRVTMTAVVDDVREALGASRAARLDVHAVPADASLVVPQRALVSALVNVVQNAIDASKDGGAVALALRDEDRFVVLAIQDHGEGMTAETLRRVGEPFFTTKEPGQGMGLGLFLVGSFLDRLGGRLKVESTLMQGATVELWVPREMTS